MNLATEALKMSTLYASSTAGGNVDYDAYKYDLAKSYPNIYKDRHVKKEIVGLRNTPLGSSASTEVSAFGLAREMYLKTTIKFTLGSNSTTNHTPNVAKHLYKAFISRVALLNSSREIQQIHGDMLQFRAISREDTGEKRKWFLAGGANLQLDKTSIQAVNTNTLAKAIGTTHSAEQSITIYTDLPFTFFDGKFQSDDGKKTSAISNFRFLETCRILVETAPEHEVVTGITSHSVSGVVIDKCELVVNYDIPSSADSMEIESIYSLDVPLSVMVGNEVLTESSVTATATGALTHPVKIFNTNLAQGFVICVHKKRDKTAGEALGTLITSGASNGTDKVGEAHGSRAGSDAEVSTIANCLLRNVSQHHAESTADLSRFGADYKRVDALTIKSSGRVLFEAETYEQVLLCTTNMCNWLDVPACSMTELALTQDANSCNDSNFYWIPFCDKPNANAFSGALSLKGLSTIDVSVTFPAIDTKTYVVKVYTIYHQITSVDANSGRLIQSISS